MRRVPTINVNGDGGITESDVKASIRGGGLLAPSSLATANEDQFATGCIVLLATARNDLVRMAQLLDATPSLVNFSDYDRRTPLHVAASEGHLTAAMELVRRGGLLNRSDRWGGSPLDDAMRHRHEDMAKFLRASGGRVGVADLQLALITASSLGEVESVEMLLSDGAKPSKGDYDKRTALHLAASEGHAPVVQRLLAAGAPPNSEDRWGGTPLDDAKEKKHSEVIELLIAAGGAPGKRRQTLTSSIEPTTNLDEARRRRHSRRTRARHPASTLPPPRRPPAAHTAFAPLCRRR